VFIDNTVANRIAELDDRVASQLDERITSDPTYIEDKSYLTKIVDSFVVKGIVRFYWNASVKREIENTKADWKRNTTLCKVQDHTFAYYHSTAYPIIMSNENPATYLTTEQGLILDDLYNALPRAYLKDIKILADALFNPEIEFLLTTDRDHLANDRVRSKLEESGLNKYLKIRTPRELFEDLKERDITIR